MKRFSTPGFDHAPGSSLCALWVVTLVVASVLTALPAHAAETDAWEIDFVSAIYGKSRATVTSKCARFDWGALVMLLNPPDYSTLIMVNPDSKLYRHQPLSDFIYGRWERTPLDGKVSNMKKVGTCVVEGVTCETYTCKIFGEDAEFQVTRELNPDPALTTAFCKMLEIPPGYGIPIGCKRYRTEVRKMWVREPGKGNRLVQKNQKLRATLQWLRVVTFRKKRVDTTALLLPRDYKRATDDFSLWWSQSGKAGKDDIAGFFMSDPDHKSDPNFHKNRAPAIQNSNVRVPSKK